MSSSKTKCIICKSNEDNEIDLGKMLLGSDDLFVHYYCLLTATNLPQREVGNNFLGFLPEDIVRYSKLNSRKICFFCKKKHAAIRCASEKCYKVFHLKCGINNHCINHFYGDFKSFCPNHFQIKHVSEHTLDSDCFICYEGMGEYNSYSSILPSCCKLGWFHRNCLKRFALESGYNFKCLLCCSEDFREEIIRIGIFVPDQMATWEKNTDTLAQLYKNCDAKECKCPKGRNFENSMEYKIFMCDDCGGNGIHRICGNITYSKGICFECSQCTKIIYNESNDLMDPNYNDNNKTIDILPCDTNTRKTEKNLTKTNKSNEANDNNILCIDLISDDSDNELNVSDVMMPLPIPLIVKAKKNAFFPRKMEVLAKSTKKNICELLSQSFRKICEEEDN